MGNESLPKIINSTLNQTTTGETNRKAIDTTYYKIFQLLNDTGSASQKEEDLLVREVNKNMTSEKTHGETFFLSPKTLKIGVHTKLSEDGSAFSTLTYLPSTKEVRQEDHESQEPRVSDLSDGGIRVLKTLTSLLKKVQYHTKDIAEKKTFEHFHPWPESLRTPPNIIPHSPRTEKEAPRGIAIIGPGSNSGKAAAIVQTLIATESTTPPIISKKSGKKHFSTFGAIETPPFPEIATVTALTERDYLKNKKSFPKSKRRKRRGALKTENDGYF